MAEAAQALDPTRIDSWKNPLAPATEKPALEPAAKPEAKPEVKPEPPAEKINVPALIGKIGKGAEEAGEKVRVLDAEAMKLTPPTPKNVPQSAAPLTSPVEIWGSAAMILAGIGSLMTRRPMVTALNAASNVLDAYKAKDMEAANRAFKVWEAENHNATQTFNFQQQAYKAALGDIDTKKEEALKTGAAKDKAAEARVKALMTAFEDVGGIAAYNEGGLPGFARHQEAQKAQLTKQTAAADKIVQQQKVVEAMRSPEFLEAKAAGDKARMLEIMAETGDPRFTAEWAKSMGLPKGRPALEPDQIESMAKMISEYQMAPPGQFAMRQPGWVQALTRAKELNPEFKPSRYQIVQKAQANLLGKDGATIRSLDVLKQHLDYFSDLIKELPNVSDVRAVNSVVNNISKRFGYPEVSNFEAARELIIKEIVKAVSGAGVGAVFDREGAKQALETAQTQDQLEGVVKTVKNLVGGQIVGLVNQYRQYIEPENLGISPDVMKFYGIKPSTDKAREKEPGVRTEEPKAEGGKAKTTVARPAYDEFMEKAREKNPGVSDADLTAFYNRKYGAP